MYSLVSQHRDGKMIGRVLAHFGVCIIHGSTSKGGIQAFRSLIQHVRAGHNLSITPDGPRGPERQASVGVAQLAMLTNAPALHFVASAPILYQPTSEKETVREALRVAIETELNRVTDEADRLAGVL